MVQKCPHCSKHIVKSPMFIVDGKPVIGNDAWLKITSGDFKGFQWKSLFAVDWGSLVFVFLFLFMIWSHQVDLNKFEPFIKEPCKTSMQTARLCGATVIEPKPEYIKKVEEELKKVNFSYRNMSTLENIRIPNATTT